MHNAGAYANGLIDGYGAYESAYVHGVIDGRYEVVQTAAILGRACHLTDVSSVTNTTPGQ